MRITAAVPVSNSLAEDRPYPKQDTPERQAVFDLCRADLAGARADAEQTIRDALDLEMPLPDRIGISVVGFAEFDSGNLSHAFGYFDVEVTGLTADEEKKLEEFIAG